MRISISIYFTSGSHSAAMTAQVLPEELEAVLGQGFDGLIMKPFRENDLLAVFSTDDNFAEESFAEENVVEGEETGSGKEETGKTAEETDPLEEANPVEGTDTSDIALDTSVVEKMTFGDFGAAVLCSVAQDGEVGREGGREKDE